MKDSQNEFFLHDLQDRIVIHTQAVHTLDIRQASVYARRRAGLVTESMSSLFLSRCIPTALSARVWGVFNYKEHIDILFERRKSSVPFTWVTQVEQDNLLSYLGDYFDQRALAVFFEGSAVQQASLIKQVLAAYPVQLRFDQADAWRNPVPTDDDIPHDLYVLDVGNTQKCNEFARMMREHSRGASASEAIAIAQGMLANVSTTLSHAQQMRIKVSLLNCPTYAGYGKHIAELVSRSLPDWDAPTRTELVSFAYYLARAQILPEGYVTRFALCEEKELNPDFAEKLKLAWRILRHERAF